MTGTSTALTLASRCLRYFSVMPPALLATVGKKLSDSAKEFMYSISTSAIRASSCLTCSSNREYMTTAPTPASARALTPSVVCWMGPAEATMGLRSGRPR